jgi:hypothetical protein
MAAEISFLRTAFVASMWRNKTRVLFGGATELGALATTPRSE